MQKKKREEICAFIFVCVTPSKSCSYEHNFYLKTQNLLWLALNFLGYQEKDGSKDFFSLILMQKTESTGYKYQVFICLGNMSLQYLNYWDQISDDLFGSDCRLIFWNSIRICLLFIMRLSYYILLASQVESLQP